LPGSGRSPGLLLIGSSDHDDRSTASRMEGALYVGVSVDRTYRLKRLESDYFATEDSDLPASAEGTIGAG
jgi:hypothetical protein